MIGAQLKYWDSARWGPISVSSVLLMSLPVWVTEFFSMGIIRLSIIAAGFENLIYLIYYFGKLSYLFTERKKKSQC